MELRTDRTSLFLPYLRHIYYRAIPSSCAGYMDSQGQGEVYMSILTKPFIITWQFHPRPELNAHHVRCALLGDMYPMFNIVVLQDPGFILTARISWSNLVNSYYLYPHQAHSNLEIVE